MNKTSANRVQISILQRKNTTEVAICNQALVNQLAWGSYWNTRVKIKLLHFLVTIKSSVRQLCYGIGGLGTVRLIMARLYGIQTHKPPSPQESPSNTLSHVSWKWMNVGENNKKGVIVIINRASSHTFKCLEWKRLAVDEQLRYGDDGGGRLGKSSQAHQV